MIISLSALILFGHALVRNLFDERFLELFLVIFLGPVYEELTGF